MDHVHFGKIVAGLFILLNPFVLIPVFLALAGDMDKAVRMKIAVTCSFSVMIIMTIAIFGGHAILNFFGITVDDFRIAGGLLIMLMALNMVRAQEEQQRYSNKEHEEAQSKAANIAVVPLAIPLMAGPASISGAIIYAGECDTLTTRAVLVGIVAALCLVLWLAMVLGEQIGRILGHTGQQILKRVMGLILLALSVDFIHAGINNMYNLGGG